MSIHTRFHRALLLGLMTNALWLGTISLPAQAESGNEPTVQYASLPSQKALSGPGVVGNLPDIGWRNSEMSAFSSLVEHGRITLRASAPTNCLPSALRDVVAQVASRFGPVSIESTHRSKGRNWSAGGAPHSLHLACRAIDFRLHARSRDVMAYLRSRPDIGGLKIYRNGIIHVDNGTRRSW